MAKRDTWSNADTLVGIAPKKADVQIFQEQRWYRVPVATWPRTSWEPKYVALFETAAASGGPQCVRYWGEVIEIAEYTGAQLFPGEPRGGRETKRYNRILVRKCEELSEPIVFDRNRRNPFILTTQKRLHEARSASELIMGSGLEERIWEGLRELDVPAEREWLFEDEQRYWLDFAVFCHERSIDVEADGDRYHLSPERAARDNTRNNSLTSKGWAVLRYTQEQIVSESREVFRQIRETIDKAGGLRSNELVPRKFTYRGKEAIQLSLMDGEAEYDVGYQNADGAE